MTKFAFMTDTHLGGTVDGYKQQVSYRDKLPELLGLFNEKLKELKDIDFVLNGGDVIDKFEPGLVKEAARIFKSDAPSYFCLGNHDLTSLEAAEGWLERAPDFFLGNSLQFEIENNDCVVHVIPNHWGDKTYFWDNDQTPSFSDKQLERLTAKLEESKDLKHVICTHTNILGVMPEQTGFDEEYHATQEPFRTELEKIISSYPQICCVICAHNHMNSIGWIGEVPVVSGTSFSESPFEYKIFEITKEKLSIKTIDLFAKTSFRPEYDFNKTFVQGRDKDRNLTIK